MLSRLILPLSLTSALLLAADFWIAKPVLQWSDKEVQKMITDSPWAHQSNYEIGALPGGRGGGPGGLSGSNLGSAEDANPGAGSRAGGGGGRAASGPQGGQQEPAPVAQAPVVVRWQSALPIKHAMLKRQFGAEMNTSEEAKKIADRQEQYYVIFVATTPQAARGLAQRKDALMETSALNIKGKEPIRPQDIQFNPQPNVAEMYVLFPRTAPIAADDKEVEFATKLGNMNVKYKFRLKEMIYNGKLEL